MKTLFPVLSALFLSAMLLGPLATRSAAQEGPLDKAQPKGTTSDEIIQRFASKEKEFKVARDLYTYRQSVKMQVLDGNTVTGEYQQVADVIFDDQGKRLEYVVFAPQSTLDQAGLMMDQGDFEDIQHRMPFVLTSDAHASEVRADEATARDLGITGVPHFLINGKWSVPGAQDVETLVLALDRAWERTEGLEQAAASN